MSERPGGGRTAPGRAGFVAAGLGSRLGSLLTAAGLVVAILVAACETPAIGARGASRDAASAPGASRVDAATAAPPSAPVAPEPTSANVLSEPTGSAEPLAPSAPVGSTPPGPGPSGPLPSSSSPLPASSAAPTATPQPGPFEMDLYEPGDFVTEASKVMCVPAAMQVMTNIMAPGPDTTVETQRRLYALARRLSPKTLKGDGAEPEGWAAGLEELGLGRFRVVALKTRASAVKTAARAIRLTGRPAGLLVWYGAHSWVMSGFRATADPAASDRFVVTAVRIEDVWYPKISTIWGRSRPPDALVPVAKLPRDFLPWRMPGGPYPDKAWKYVVVIPVD
jgi:hypothetical protein